MRPYRLAMIVVAIASASLNQFSLAQDFRAPTQTLPKGPWKSSVRPGLTTPDSLRFERPPQAGALCGPNALYVLLHLYGIETSYERILDVIPHGENGSNLDDLDKTANQFGLSTEVRKLTPEELADAPKPLIAHFLTNRDGTNSGKTNHFAVITRNFPEGEGYEGVDAANGGLYTWTPQTLARNFSGYCLLPARRPSTGYGRRTFLVMAFTGILLVNILLQFRTRNK